MLKSILTTISYSCLSVSMYAQWQQCAGTSGLNMQALMTNGIYNYAGGQTGSYLSTDTAANYALSNSGNDSLGPTRGYTKDNTFIYTCSSQGAFRSADNGVTWVSKSVGLTNLLGGGILNVGTRLFYVGPTGVFMSTNQGDNWSAAGLASIDVRSIAAINDTLFAGTYGAGIYKSVDFGANWVAINNGLNGALNFRAMESKGNTLFAGGPTGTGVFRSTDFGANWTLLAGGLTSGSYRGFASNSQLIVAGSFGGGVFYSTDNGDNWTAINSGLTDSTIFDLELNANYIVAATNTEGVFRYPISSLNLPSGISEVNLTAGITVFPNPTTEQINLKAESVGSVYTITDNVGRIVASDVITSNNTIIDVSNWSSGIYFLTVMNEAKQSLKFIKQ